jgi:hypothetical protein
MFPAGEFDRSRQEFTRQSLNCRRWWSTKEAQGARAGRRTREQHHRSAAGQARRGIVRGGAGGGNQETEGEDQGGSAQTERRSASVRVDLLVQKAVHEMERHPPRRRVARILAAAVRVARTTLRRLVALIGLGKRVRPPPSTRRSHEPALRSASGASPT